MTCLLVICLIGSILIYYTGWFVLIYGVIGIIGAITYTLWVSYKYHKFGQICVFAMMGMLMPMGTYYVLSGQFS